MTEKLQVYKCIMCGNIVEVLHAGKGELVCCGKPMELLVENTQDASLEKHVPVLEKKAEKLTVKIGSNPHPMEEKHYIEWAEIIIEDKVYREFLEPGGKPEAVFQVAESGKDISARIYCNIHGLWES